MPEYINHAHSNTDFDLTNVVYLSAFKVMCSQIRKGFNKQTIPPFPKYYLSQTRLPKTYATHSNI